MTQQTAPAAAPTKGVPISDPRHWSHYRKAQTDDERLELAAAQWTPDEAMERVRLIRDRHPDLFGRVKVHPSALAAYETKRGAAVEAGRTIAAPSPALVEQIDHLADEVRATDADVPVWKVVRRELLATFRRAVDEAVTFADLREAWRAVLSGIDEHEATMRRRSAALALFTPGAIYQGVTDRPTFLRELESAVESGSSFGWGVGVGEAGIAVSNGDFERRQAARRGEGD